MCIQDSQRGSHYDLFDELETNSNPKKEHCLPAIITDGEKLLERRKQGGGKRSKGGKKRTKKVV